MAGTGPRVLERGVNRDYNVVQAIVLFTVVCFIVINLLTDLICGLLDPRIRFN